jgi:hypothetical protein
VLAALNGDAAVDDDGVDVGGGRRQQDLVGRATGGADGVQAEGNQVGAGADGKPSGVGPTERVVVW